MSKGCLLGFIWEIKSLGDGRLCSANKVNMQIKEFIVLYAEKPRHISTRSPGNLDTGNLKLL